MPNDFANPMKTYTPKAKHIERRWWIVDAADKPLGRLATEVARVLRGKHKPIFTPHLDTGDHVVVINASLVRLTGKKATRSGISGTLATWGASGSFLFAACSPLTPSAWSSWRSRA